MQGCEDKKRKFIDKVNKEIDNSLVLDKGYGYNTFYKDQADGLMKAKVMYLRIYEGGM